MRKRIIIMIVAVVLLGIIFWYRNIFKEKEYLEDQDISWEKAQGLVLGCRAEKVFQTHALKVTVVLNNGVKLTATEPVIDDIMDIAVSAREKCGNIVIGTE
jgi:hypothetical protein